MTQSRPYLSVAVLFISMVIATPCMAQTGACCFNNGACLVLEEDECYEMGADWWIEGEVCDPNACYQLGACCYPPHWQCFLLPEEECATHEDYYWEPFTTCEPAP